MSFSGKIKLYVFLLVAVVLTFTFAVGIFVYSKQMDQLKWEAHWNDFHMATYREISNLQLELLRLKEMALAGKSSLSNLADGAVEDETRRREKNRGNVFLFFIREKTDLILGLHQKIDEKPFSFMVRKVRSSFSEFSIRFQNTFHRSFQISQRDIDAIEEFMTSLEQLKRLHLIAYGDKLAELAEIKRQDNWIMAVGVSFAVVLGMILAWRLLTLIGIAIRLKEKAEKEIVELNSVLEKRVEEKTWDLQSAQTELLKKEKMATLGRVTAMVSHELRNPLGTMKISLHLIEQGIQNKTKPIGRAISRLKRNLDRCDQIIDDMLDFTRTSEMTTETVSIDLWLREVLDEQGVPKGIDLKIDLGMPGLTLSVDPNRLRRAVINVMENACQAMLGNNETNDSGGPGRLTVTTRISGERAEISISDTGPGIPPEVLENIFEPLFSTKSFGVGLGLPIVRDILAQHDGGIEIESEQAHGANFVLWIPIHHDSNETTT